MLGPSTLKMRTGAPAPSWARAPLLRRTKILFDFGSTTIDSTPYASVASAVNNVMFATRANRPSARGIQAAVAIRHHDQRLQLHRVGYILYLERRPRPFVFANAPAVHEVDDGVTQAGFLVAFRKVDVVFLPDAKCG